MALSHRLCSSMYERPDEGIDELPKRVIFLSVEGNITEREYFQFVHKYRETLHIKTIVHIEPLSRGKDTCSDPQSVLRLLEDCVKLQTEGISMTELSEELLRGEQTFPKTQIERYISGELGDRESEDIEDALRMVGIDSNYQKFLSDYKGEDSNDLFAVVIDRDSKCHSERGLKKLFQECREKGYDCYITNPCFEFWLLLHVCDVKNEFAGHFEELRKNEKISNKHTFVSQELSARANHAKSISEQTFRTKYLPNIDTAILRANQFNCFREEDLLTGLGSNLPKLFEKMRDNP